MAELAFSLNGENIHLHNVPETQSLLDWLREFRRLTGTKEGCNEGDCGACSVIVTDEHGSKALNACILFMPQLNGKAVRTVEGVSSSTGQLHPVQQAMVEHHGSQCGFCTPGFITTMAAAHKNDKTDFDDQLAGNLCRCTGYAPIIKAAHAASRAAVPSWMDEKLPDAVPQTANAHFTMPGSADELADWLTEHPNATLVAGATDVGLWVTKGLQNLESVAFLSAAKDLRYISQKADGVEIGAMTTIAELRTFIEPIHPSFAEMLRRFASEQIRSAATLGGNIANGSPIGDAPPALIALGAELRLRKGSNRRVLPIADFFLAYGKQDIEPGEFLESVFLPKQEDRLKCYKLSKRFDQDISAVCGCLNIIVDDGRVTNAKIAFGGMAGIPKRATNVENALIGKEWSIETIQSCASEWSQDFTPMSDQRASAEYRLETARNMLMRYFFEDQGQPSTVLEVSP